MEGDKQKQTDTGNGKSSEEKYIHVSEIPIQKLEDDKDFQDSLKNKRNNTIDPKQPEAERNNETMGIP